MTINKILHASTFESRAEVYITLAPALREKLFTDTVRKFSYRCDPFSRSTLKTILDSKQDFPSVLSHAVRYVFTKLPEIEKARILASAIEKKNESLLDENEIHILHSLIPLLEDPSQEMLCRKMYKELKATTHNQLHATGYKVATAYEAYIHEIGGRPFDGSGIFRSSSLDRQLWLKTIEKTLDNTVDVSTLYSLMEDATSCERSNIISALEQDAMALEFVSKDLCQDYQLVELAVTRKGEALQFASDELRDNHHIVKIAVEQNGHAIKYASSNLKNDRDIAKIAVAQDGLALRHLPSHFSSDKEIIRIAAEQNGWALCLASEELRNDPEIVKIAVAQEGSSLQHADKNLRKNPEIVRIAAAQNGLAIEYASLKLKKDSQIVKIAVTQNPTAFEYIEEAFKNDQAFILDCIAKNPAVYEYSTIAKDSSFQEEAARRHLDVLKYFSFDEKQFIIDKCKKNFFDLANYNRTILWQTDRSDFFKVNEKKQMQTMFIEHLKSYLYPHLEENLSILIADVLEMKNKDLKYFFLHSFYQLNPSSAKEIASEITKSVNGDQSNTKKKLIQLHFAILSSSAEKKTKDMLIESIYEKKKILKDIFKLQPLLLIFKDLYLQNEPKLYEILSIALQTSNKDTFSEKISYLSCLLALKPTRFAILDEEQIENNITLVKLLLQDLTEAGMRPKGCDDRKLANYLTSLRKPHALLSYITLHKNNSSMVKALKTLLETEIQGTFLQTRHASNFHRSYLQAEQKIAWESAIDELQIKKIIDAKPPQAIHLNVVEFLHKKICCDLHGYNKFKEITPYLESLHQGHPIIKPELEDNSVEYKVLHLLEAKNLIESFEDLRKAMQQNNDYKNLEFINDINEALADLRPVELGAFTIIDTENAEELFLCGTEVTGSCQRIDGDSKLNCCLMSYVLDGKVRLLAVKNQSNTIIARVILKLLIDKDDKPILFIERIYGDKSFKNVLYGLAIEKASQMNVPLLEAGYEIPIRSLGTPAPYEYEDGGAGVSKNGVYQITGRRV